MLDFYFIVKSVGAFCDADTRRALKLYPRRFSEKALARAESLFFPGARNYLVNLEALGFCGNIIYHTTRTSCSQYLSIDLRISDTTRSMHLTKYINNVQPRFTLELEYRTKWHSVHVYHCEDIVYNFKGQDGETTTRDYAPGSAIVSAYPNKKICRNHFLPVYPN
jgi:hypothetical protein